MPVTITEPTETRQREILKCRFCRAIKLWFERSEMGVGDAEPPKTFFYHQEIFSDTGNSSGVSLGEIVLTNNID